MPLPVRPDAPLPPDLADLRAGGARRRRWIKYWITDVAEGALDYVLHQTLPLAGVEGCSAIGARLGCWSIPRNHAPWQDRADAALRQLRPDLDAAGRAALIDRRNANIGRIMTEFSVLHRIHRQDRVSIVGAERLRAALEDPRPLVLASLHLGNWEIMASPHHLYRLSGARGRPAPLHVVYQPPRSRVRDAQARACRERLGATLLPPGRPAGPAAARALRHGGRVWIAVDDFRNRQVHGPLFGRPPDRGGNLGLAVRLAALSGARVLPVWVLRDEGVRFTLHVGPEPADWSGHLEVARRGRPEGGIAAVNAIVEPVVRAHLDQWFMLHELRLAEGAPGGPDRGVATP